MLEKEASGSITAIERAALDALREICAEEGMPLDGPPAPPPLVRTRTIQVSAPASPATTTPVSNDDSADDEHKDSADEEDDEHEEAEDEEEEEEEEEEDD